MLRFAFSPTHDMNIGDLRVAILNYIVSKQRGEGFIVRIEDMDKERSSEQKEQEMLGILGLFGIEYSHVVHQSQNFRFHAAMALQLLHEKRAFNCFCSHEWLEKKREEAKNNNKAYRYDDACASLPDELVIDNENPFTVRIKKSQEPTAESFIIMSEDKRPTYSFACGIDDMLGDISLVIRDEEHMDDALKEDWIRTSLGYQKKIEYAHIPAMQNGTSSVKWLLEEGFLPSAITNYLISTVNKPPKEIFTMQEAIEWFSLENISKSPARFDIDLLKQINREHLMMLDAKELSRYVGFADIEIGELAKIYLEEANTTKELRIKVGAVFAPKEIPEELKETVAMIAAIIKKAPYFDRYEEFENHIMQECGIKGENLFKSIRLLLTGSEHTPDIAAVYKCIKNYIGEIVK